MQKQFKRKKPQREDSSVDNKSTLFKFANQKFKKNSPIDFRDQPFMPDSRTMPGERKLLGSEQQVKKNDKSNFRNERDK